jgi:hypothetical protein
MSSYAKSADQGYATTVWAATAHDLEGRSGVCCEGRIAALLVRCCLSLMDTTSLGAGGFRGGLALPKGKRGSARSTTMEEGA